MKYDKAGAISFSDYLSRLATEHPDRAAERRRWWRWRR